MKDKIIIRELANRYFAAANSDTNRERILLHKQVNDLKHPRPIVLIDEIPWQEMNINDELTLQCEDEFNRNIEFYFRTSLYKWKHMPADMVLTPYYSVPKHVYSTGIGIAQITNEHEQDALTHTFIDQLQTEADLEKLHSETVTYDGKGTFACFCRTAELFGDVLPVKIVGHATGYALGCRTWDDIVNYRGLENLFIDMIERPEFIHMLVSKLTELFLDKVRQFDEMNLFDGDAYYIHGTSALTNDLNPDQNHVRAKDVWGRGLAQILATVSPQMHDEFDIQYMMKAMEPFGLVYYGCCEPLDHKIDILEKIKNLRKISITPWANIDNAAEIIQNRYVIASKPNPAQVAVDCLDPGAVRKELSGIVSACRKNGCSCDIVLKDISTVCNRPQNLFEWEKIAMETVLDG